MKHALLSQVWQVRDQISAECGYDVRRLAALVRREEDRYPGRLVRAPKPAPEKGKRARLGAELH